MTDKQKVILQAIAACPEKIDLLYETAKNILSDHPERNAGLLEQLKKEAAHDR